MNLAFYVSGGATRLIKALHHLEQNNKDLLNEIKFVFIDNCDNNSLREICNRLSIKIHELDISQIEKGSISNTLSDKLLELLENEKIDYGFVFGGRILKGEILKRYEHKLINFHPSLLPLFKGLNAIDQALKEKVFLLGNSAHFISDKLDSGEIIMQSIFPASSYKEYDDVLDMQINMLVQIILWIKEGRVEVKNGCVNISNAKYEPGEYVPNLEFST